MYIFVDLVYVHIVYIYIYMIHIHIYIYIYIYIYVVTCWMINKSVSISDILQNCKQTAIKYTSNEYNVKQWIHQSIFALNSKNKGSTLVRPKIPPGFYVERINLTCIVQHDY